MNVLVRPKRSEAGLRRRRQSSAPPAEERANLQSEATPAAHAVTESRNRRRRELGPLHDQAEYTCQCGFVFQASVSTSVGCPHCGDIQAW
jgi:rubrerythrin